MHLVTPMDRYPGSWIAAVWGSMCLHTITVCMYTGQHTGLARSVRSSETYSLEMNHKSLFGKGEG